MLSGVPTSEAILSTCTQEAYERSINVKRKDELCNRIETKLYVQIEVSIGTQAASSWGSIRVWSGDEIMVMKVILDIYFKPSACTVLMQCSDN